MALNTVILSATQAAKHAGAGWKITKRVAGEVAIFEFVLHASGKVLESLDISPSFAETLKKADVVEIIFGCGNKSTHSKA